MTGAGWRRGLLAVAVAAAAVATGLPALAGEPAASGVAPGPSGGLRAEAVARCIARHAPGGGQFFEASDGTFRVVSFGPRGKVAEWIVRAGTATVQVSREGGSAGLDRPLKGTCY